LQSRFGGKPVHLAHMPSLEKIGLDYDVNKAGHWHADDAHRTGNVKATIAALIAMSGVASREDERRGECRWGSS
jgi:hypothetical protein